MTSEEVLVDKGINKRRLNGFKQLELECRTLHFLPVHPR